MVECDFNDEKVALIPHYDGGGLKIALMEIKVRLPYQQLFCIASCILLQVRAKVTQPISASEISFPC